MTYSRISDFEGDFALFFECGELPADETVVAAGHKPNGYFWEGVAAVIAPELMQSVEFDSESDMFSASGDRDALESLQAKLEPLLVNGHATQAVIMRAASEGFEFDD